MEAAKNVAYAHPNISQWPEVTFPGFYDTTEVLQVMTGMTSVAFLPIVQPSELCFEKFMYQYFAEEPAIPPGTGVHWFGKGVYAINPNSPNVTYHYTTGIPLLFNSSHHILVQFLQMTFSKRIRPSRLSFNAHSDPILGPAMEDRIIA